MCGTEACSNLIKSKWIGTMSNQNINRTKGWLDNMVAWSSFSLHSLRVAVWSYQGANVFIFLNSSAFLSLFQGELALMWGDTGQFAHQNHQTWPSDLKSLVDVFLCQTSPLPAPPLLCSATLLQLQSSPMLHWDICCIVATPSSRTQLNSPQVFSPSLQHQVQLRLTPLLDLRHLNIWSGEGSTLVAVEAAPSPCISTTLSVTCCCIFPPALLRLLLPPPPSPWFHPLLSTSTTSHKPRRARDVFLTQTYLIWTMMSEDGGVQRILGKLPSWQKYRRYTYSNCGIQSYCMWQ